MFTIEAHGRRYGPHREKKPFTYMHKAGVPNSTSRTFWLIGRADMTAW